MWNQKGILLGCMTKTLDSQEKLYFGILTFTNNYYSRLSQPSYITLNACFTPFLCNHTLPPPLNILDLRNIAYFSWKEGGIPCYIFVIITNLIQHSLSNSGKQTALSPILILHTEQNTLQRFGTTTISTLLAVLASVSLWDGYIIRTVEHIFHKEQDQKAHEVMHWESCWIVLLIAWTNYNHRRLKKKPCVHTRTHTQSI